jgi:hypothetical protein
LGDNAGFPETEISLPAIHGLTHSHVIHQLDLKNVCRLADSVGQASIAFARVEVA